MEKRFARLSKLDTILSLCDTLGISKVLLMGLSIAFWSLVVIVMWAYDNLSLSALLLLSLVALWLIFSAIERALRAFSTWKNVQAQSPVDKAQLAADAETLALEIQSIQAQYQALIIGLDRDENWEDIERRKAGKDSIVDTTGSSRLRAQMQSALALAKVHVRFYDILARAQKHLSLEKNELISIRMMGSSMVDRWTIVLVDIAAKLRYAGDDIPQFDIVKDRLERGEYLQEYARIPTGKPNA